MIKYIAIIFVIVVQLNVALANVESDKDTIPFSENVLTDQFVNNLDSMLNLWYVKAALSEEAIANVDTVIPEFSDSVYIERLGEIPSVFKLSYNRIVKNYIDLYTKKRREQVEMMLGLSEFYFPIFEELLDAQGLPLELKYLPVIESALNPRAVSKAGAAGLWQFMYATGRMYKLEINSFVDERRDPIKASYAGVKYLKDLYKIYNDWTLVIAAYNCGPGNVNKAIRRSGGKRNYWAIYYYLPRETRGYVPAFIAATYTFNYHKEHNIAMKKVEMPLVTDTIMVNQKLHLKQVAEVLNIPVEQIRDLNPQYRRDIIPAGRKSYCLKLPMDLATRFIDSEDSIYAYKDSIFFDPSHATLSPRSRSYTAYTPDPPKGHEKVHYTVKSGDNLGSISEWYGVGLSQLRYWNNIRRNLIRTGQKLVVYVPKNKVAKCKQISSMTFAQKQKMIGKSVSASTTSVMKENIEKNYSGDYIYYKVRSGDNFWTIARRYPGVSNTDIMRLNEITDSRSLKPNQMLKIKRKS